MALNFSQTQKISQKQVQKLSQVQIQSLKYLAMNSLDLKNEIYAEVEKNPALEIKSDGEDSSPEQFDAAEKNGGEHFSDDTKIRGTTDSGRTKSDAFQEIIESKADTRETLSEHLLSQFALAKLPENQRVLGEKLIRNLDKNGFHILAPVSFLNYGEDTEQDLAHCLSVIQNLEPCGCCCTNIEESLLIQAKARKNPPEAALFLLDGHLDFLDPPNAAKVLKKIRDFVKNEKNKSFSTDSFDGAEQFDEEQIQNAIQFIQTLNPHPAGGFSSAENPFIAPEIFVKKIPFADSGIIPGAKIVSETGSEENPVHPAHSFIVQTSRGILPEVTVSKEYTELLKTGHLPPGQQDTVKKLVQDGKTFLESLQFRDDSVFQAAVAIVKAQTSFFENGPGNLVVFRQKDLAQILGVHETTVSRIANNKYLECEWGIFPLKYFFVNGVPQSSAKSAPDIPSEKKSPEENPQTEIFPRPESQKTPQIISKDKILFEIQAIISAQPPGEKQLSDQKLADLLSEKGIKVARRTVAKYRAQLGVKSSYDR